MTKLEHLPKLKTADECQTMTDVRHEVDRIDMILVELVAERQSFMGAAARLKESRDMVYDAPRIEDVIQKVLKSAEVVGLSPNIAEPVWRLLITQCIEFEYSRFDQTHKI